ncbi:DNA polymerase III, subunit gamma and tau, partial [Patescibacteria group bacterium]|nr:DNA polymerase III, subunit gamma and tau [Patescibacteria group bacterium]
MSVFHLKYRPQKIGDLDLQEVSDKIKSIVLSDNEFQSLLFAGPKGSGKTSAARILSKTVNCLKIK